MQKIELCGVARALVQSSAKWPAVQKVWPPLVFANADCNKCDTVVDPERER